MPRISQLPSLTTADNADEIAIVDVSSSTTKKITRGDLLKAPLPANSVNTAAVVDNAIKADKVDFTTFDITYGGGPLSSDSTTRTITPEYDGLLIVRAHARRNQSNAADNIMNITLNGAEDVVSYTALGYGSVDAFVANQAMGRVKKGVPVTITITSVTPSQAGYTFVLHRGNAIKI